MFSLFTKIIRALGNTIGDILKPMVAKFPAFGKISNSLGGIIEGALSSSLGSALFSIFAEPNAKMEELLTKIGDRLSAFHADMKSALGLSGQEQGPPLPPKMMDGAGTPTPMTPEELQAAYAPSPEMQARIDAVTESFGRLADPLLPELEARIESLCAVLDECAAHCSSGPCAEGQAA